MLFNQARAVPISVPSQTPNGPMMNAVTGTMISRQKNGTKTICRFSGKIRFRPW